MIGALIVAMAPPRAEIQVATPTDSASKAAAGTSADTAQASATIGYAQIQPVIAQRCYGCHGQAMQMKNIRLDSAALLAQHAQAVYQQAVVLRAMPMNNATQITEDERTLIKKWFESGARVN